MIETREERIIRLSKEVARELGCEESIALAAINARFFTINLFRDSKFKNMIMRDLNGKIPVISKELPVSRVEVVFQSPTIIDSKGHKGSTTRGKNPDFYQYGAEYDVDESGV